MQGKTKSLLQELEALSNQRDLGHIVESRGHNIITSAINLLELINKHYSVEQSQILERKLLAAIKNRDQAKFSRSVKKHESE
jgi:hypothetical protein